MSAVSLLAAGFARGRRGAVAVEFAFILPVLLVLTMGLIEVSLLVFDYHRAGEAMRQAVRAIEIGPAITSYAILPVSCPGGGVCDVARFNAVLADIQAVIPDFGPDNLQITYSASGLDDAATPGVVTPFVTVSVVNLQHDLLILNSLVPGLPASITFPPFSTTRLVQSVIE